MNAVRVAVSWHSRFNICMVRYVYKDSELDGNNVRLVIRGT
jgi:hypothetical protein